MEILEYLCFIVVLYLTLLYCRSITVVGCWLFKLRVQNSRVRVVVGSSLYSFSDDDASMVLNPLESVPHEWPSAISRRVILPRWVGH